jgi:SAM-dependent methyltransferase
MDANLPANALFDLGSVFEVEDYLFVYGDDLSGERSDAEVAALVKQLDLDTSMKILDLACGFGRHTNRLAALGHTVTGVDLMPGFLALARQEAAEMGVQVDYRQGDMRQASFREEFDRVVLLFTSFGYFEDAENEVVIANMAQALKPGGRLLFDVPNRDLILKDLSPAQVIEKDGDLLVNRLSFDVLSGRFHNQRIVIRHGIRRDKPFSIRLYNATEISRLLSRAGLVGIELFDENDLPLSAASRRMVVIARKPLQGSHGLSLSKITSVR